MIRVLIVDDDKLARKGIISIMPWEKFKMQIIGDVQNGRAALDFLQEQEVDLMFVDIDMPELGGIELMEACRTLFPNVQFVVLTFYEEFTYAQAAIRYGALEYISKVQLEMEEGDTILERVFYKFKERRKAYSVIAENQKDWDDVKREWNQLYWLFDTAHFETLLKRTRQLELDNRSIERLLVKCFQSIDNSLGREESRMPFFTEVNSTLDWLCEWRNALYQWVILGRNGDSMQGCIIRGICYVNQHLIENVNAEEVADVIGMSRSYFSVNFKKFTGKTFHEYVKGERMRLAVGLLVNKDKKIIDIANESGFDDINYFNRVFHEEMKCSPTEFRKQFIGIN